MFLIEADNKRILYTRRLQKPRLQGQVIQANTKEDTER